MRIPCSIQNLIALTVTLLLLAGSAQAVVFEFSTPISGDVVAVTLELEDVVGLDAVDVVVSIPPGEGDLLGVFGNVVDETIVPGMAVEDSTGLVTQWQFSANKVSKVGGGNTMAPIKKWDWGIRIAENGSAAGAIESASFRLLGPGLDVAQLTDAVNQGWVFGIRIQSTSGGEGSSKMGLGDGVPPIGEAPTITIDSPPDGTITAGTPISIIGTVTGTDPAVTVNGVPAVITGQSYTVEIALMEGSNSVVATAENALGSATAQVLIVLDTIAPVVTLTSPVDGTFTSSTLVMVEGTVTDASPIASFEINGTVVALIDGAFSTTLTIAIEMTTTIEAIAIDAAGNLGSSSAVVSHGIPPTIGIVNPLEGSFTNVASQVVSGGVTGTIPLAVTVDAETGAVVGSGFTATVVLVEGANTLTATVSSPFGTASDQVTATLDSAPPVVVITSPANGTQTTDDTVVIEGTVVDDNPIAQFDIDGQVVALVNGAFSIALALPANASTSFSATAVDVAGNSGSAAVTVERGEAPTIQIESPTDGALLGETPVTLSGTVTGSAPVTVTVGGLSTTAVAGSYSLAIPLVEGPNALSATATNAFGNAATNVSVTLDTTPPVVLIGAPVESQEFESSPITVSGGVVDASPITSLILNGTAIAPANSFMESVALVEGGNGIVVEATDSVGNIGSATANVTLAVAEPLEIEILTPPTGVLVSTETITVAGSVSDPTAAVNVNGVFATVTGAQWVATVVPLVDGSNAVIATAVRGAESVNDSIAVVYNAPPVVSILSPEPGSVLSGATTDVEGVVDDVTALVSVNGVVATVDSGGRFVAVGVPLEVGSNPLVARAVDPLGAAGRDDSEVTRDDNVLGEIRVVMLARDRKPFLVGDASPAGVSIAASDLASYRQELLDQTALDPAFFDPEITQISVGTIVFSPIDPTEIYLYVFVSMGEIGQDVTLQEFNPQIPIDDRFASLQPIADLAIDLQSIGQDASLVNRLLPVDFESNGFARFDIPLVDLGGGGGEGGE